MTYGQDLRSVPALAAEEVGRDGSAPNGDLRAAAGVAVLSSAGFVRAILPGAAGGADGARKVALAVRIPMKTVSALNAREHWRARARRVKGERVTVAWNLAQYARPSLPCVVTLTRVAPSNGLDSDNLLSSMKGARDQIAEWLGVDDRDPLVVWQYAQTRGKPREYAVLMEVAHV